MCLYSFGETAAGISTLPVFLLGSISQHHSSFSNTLALIGPHPHQLSLTTSSTVSSEGIQMYLVRSWSMSWHAGWCIWIAYVDSWAVRWHRADPGTALSFFSPVDACLYLYPQWCGGLVIMWPISLLGGQGYNTPACQRSLSHSLARALSISLPLVPGLLKFSLISQRPLFYLRGAWKCIRIADIVNLSSIARRHLMSLWVYPAKHTIKCSTRWETWLQFV